MKARMSVVGSLGELLVEFVCSERDGHNLRPSSYVGPFPSGAPGIFIDQAARVGGSAIFAGAVGDDAFGTVILNRLRASGVAEALLRVVPGVPTGSAFVSYNSDGTRDFVFNMAHSAAARFPSGPEAIGAFLAAGTSVLHVSGSALGDPTMRRTCLDICVALNAAGVEISIDPNIRKELMADADYLTTVRQLISFASYILPSEEDAELLYPGQSFADYAPGLIAGGARAVVLKRGAEGCSGLDENGIIVELAAHPVTVVDPTGAGDCFCATFVTLMDEGSYDLRAALTRANAAGALAVGKLGPMEGNSTLGQIESFLTRGSE